MKREKAGGLVRSDRRSPTANRELTARGNGLDTVAAPRLRWDPYEVWRTRVKGSSTVMQGRKRDRFHWRLRLALRGRRLPTSNARA
jgi:hypothetical protein